MKKKLTLWILLLPTVLLAQVEIKDGALTIDFSKKKNQPQDTVHTQNNNEEQPARVKKQKTNRPTPEEESPDFSKEGLFKALFIAGLNLSQIDGDNQAGYAYPGAHVGVGVMVKFHKYMSVNTAILYGMKGAYRKLNSSELPQRTWRQQWDYIQLPLMFNVHDKKLVMASVGLSFNYLIRDKLTASVFDGAGKIDDTQTQILRDELSMPTKKFDLGGVAAFQFLIKRVFGIGARFEYSLIGLKPALAGTKVKEVHNNSITFRLMYILDPVEIKNKKKKRM